MKFFTLSSTRTFVLFLCFSGLSFLAQAQRTITGTIKDQETGEPLIGVTVLEKGAPNNGTITNIDGKFTLKVRNEATALIVSYTGYPGSEHSIVGTDVLDIDLTQNAELQEVIVIGYGTVKREDATGLVQSVSSTNFNRGAITGPQDLLAGKISGVNINSDGSPGGGAKIRIRGESSLSASNDPLIVVDGIPLDNGGVNGSRNQLNLINPNDIESMTVLKDASATAIYGNRASGGVIIITTKKGKLGKKIQLSYNANVSVGQTTRRIDVLTADEFRATVHARYDNPDPNAPPHPAIGLLGTANTNWQDEIYQSAFGTDHSLSASGGIGIVPYRVSVGYTSKDGLLKTDNFSRYSGALNLNPGFLNNTLQVNLHFKGMLSDNHFADRGAIGSALSFDPTKTVRDTSARYGGFTTWVQQNGNPNLLAPTNPIALLELRNDNSTVKHYIANATVDYRFSFLPALRANLSLGYDHAKGEGTIVVPNYAAFAFDGLNGGGVNNQYEQTKKNSVLEAYLNYKKAFGVHEVDVMGGYSWQHFQVGSSFRNSDSAGTPGKTAVGTDPAEYFLVSLFGRLNYSYQGKYLLTGTLRRDGTSRFAPDYRYGLFPAAALAVKLIDNDDRYLNNIKLRASWGVTGQQDIGDYYAYLARYQFGTPNAQYQFGNEFVTTIRPNGYVTNIKWEETTTYNGGVDFSIVNNRIGGSLDIYQRNTKDLLNNIPFSALSNLTNFITTNIGTMKTNGIEFSLNFSPIQNKLVKWDFATNIAYNTSRITKLTTSDDPKYIGVATGGIAGGVGSNIQIHSVGYFPSSFYVFEQKYDENGTLLEGQFVDRNGDGIVNDDDKYRYQNPAPLYNLGLTSNLSVGHFSFSFAGRANLGNYVYNNVQTDMGYLNRLFGTTKYLANVNQSAVDLNVVDQAKLTFSDHFITKASFFKLDHVTMGYSFDHLIGSYLNLFVTVQNPLVITAYDGLDPEIGNGIDNNLYPRPRTYLFGVSVNFN